RRCRFITETLKGVSLRDFKSKHGAALLSFRGVLRRSHSINAQVELVPVWTGNRLAQSLFFFSRMGQIPREIVTDPGKKLHLKRLVTAADARISGGGRRRQNRCDFLTQPKQLRTVVKDHGIVRGPLACAWR